MIFVSSLIIAGFLYILALLHFVRFITADGRDVRRYVACPYYIKDPDGHRCDCFHRWTEIGELAAA